MSQRNASSIDQAMVMAAGLGTRLRPFTDVMPKPCLPLLGVPMVQFGVDALAQAGVKKIVANVHHLPERAVLGLDACDRGGAKLEISDESDLLLGSAGGIQKALPRFGGKPFFLMNSDVLCEVDLAALAAHHARMRREHGVWITLTVFRAGPAGGKYREIHVDEASSLITGFGELECERPFFAGVAVIEPEALRGVPASGPAEFVPTILTPAIQAGKAAAFMTSGLWYDIGSPELWLETHLELIAALEGARAPELWRKRIESRSAQVRPGVWCEREFAGRVRGLDWKAGSYWASMNDGENPPRALGPRSVLYGRGEIEPSSIGYAELVATIK